MPSYDYKCSKCGDIAEHDHSMREDPVIMCPKCGVRMTRMFSPFLFLIKGGTEVMHWREKQNRLKKREIIAKKQRDRWGEGPKIIPNINGVVQESWSDCQKLAKEANLNYESYTPFVEKEKMSRRKLIY